MKQKKMVKEREAQEVKHPTPSRVTDVVIGDGEKHGKVGVKKK